MLHGFVLAAPLLIGLLHLSDGASDDPGPGSESTERLRAVDRAVCWGLGYLVRQQLDAGCWSGQVGHKQGDGYVVLDPTRHGQVGQGHVGVTALVGLALLADGHVPDRGRYAHVLNGIIDYLVRHSNETGYMSDNETRMYSHAFATLFLAQVQGMSSTRAQQVDATLRKAVSFIEATQNSYGGWRYSPFTTETDLSVTVCQVQSLRAARNTGIHVSKSCIDRVIDYVKQSRIESGELAGAFYYKIYGRAAYTKTSFTINAAAATSRHSAGVYDSAQYGRAIEFLEEQYEELSTYYPAHFYYWYGNYYAAQAMHLEGGRRWERYWKRLSDDLLSRQRPDGSWPNSVGPGDSFSTAMACLLLRIPAQYLPIFQK